MSKAILQQSLFSLIKKKKKTVKNDDQFQIILL